MSVSSISAKRDAQTQGDSTPGSKRCQIRDGRRRGWRGRSWEDQWTAKANYPFLDGSFGQCVAISEIIDFYVLDVVPILLICLAGDSLAGSSGRLDDGRTNGLCAGQRMRMRLRWGGE